MRRVYILAMLALLLPPLHAVNGVPSEGAATSIGLDPVRVEVFVTPGCADCATVKREVLPILKSRCGEFVDLRVRNVQEKTNYVLLANLQETLDFSTDETVSAFVERRIALAGPVQIANELVPTVEQVVSESVAAAGDPVGNPAGPTGRVPRAAAPPVSSEADVLERRLQSFTVPAVALAGLVDGVNPCAFATIVFFVTLLSVSGRGGHDLLITGLGFCGAVFATYFVVGLGAFGVLRSLHGISWGAAAVKWITVTALVVLAGLSFRDAWRYHQTGRAGDVLLQLPDSVKRRIHAVMRSHLPRHGLLLGAVVIGILVTLLETVCTGQVYLPTLVFMTEHEAHGGRAWRLLLVYNIFFIVPLLVIFAAAYTGTTSQRLVDWSRRNVVWSKVTMGTFFLALAAALLLL